LSTKLHQRVTLSSKHKSAEHPRHWLSTPFHLYIGAPRVAREFVGESAARLISLLYAGSSE
jgi:hypothetical protein